MTQITATHDRYDLAATGDNVREHLSDIIVNISPTETPFQSNIGRTSIKSNYYEWLGDALASATANARIDGDEFAGTTLNAAERFGNYAKSWRFAA